MLLGFVALLRGFLIRRFQPGDLSTNRDFLRANLWLFLLIRRQFLGEYLEPVLFSLGTRLDSLLRRGFFGKIGRGNLRRLDGLPLSQQREF